MSEKQLNFLEIFDHQESPESLSELSSIPEDRDAVESDPVLFDQSEIEQRQAAEQLVAEQLAEQQRQELLARRQRLLSANTKVDLSDFREFMPEIQAYYQRLADIKASFDAAAPGEDKQYWYSKLVSPEIYDDFAYQESARLYRRYLEVSKAEHAREHAQMVRDQVLKKKIKKQGRDKSKIKSKHQPDIDLYSGKNAAARMYD